MVSLCPRCGAEYPLEIQGPGVARIGPQCRDCHLVVEQAPPMLVPNGDHDELDIELEDWEVADRGALTAALAERDVPYRWEPGLTLVVREADEDLVDSLLDDLEDAEWEADEDEDDDEDDDEAEDGGEEAQAAMADAFVAADRLSHNPDDSGAALTLLSSAEVVDASSPPYGIEDHVWERVQALTDEVTRHLEGSTDEDAVAASARTLRDFLRGYV